MMGDFGRGFSISVGSSIYTSNTTGVEATKTDGWVYKIKKHPNNNLIKMRFIILNFKITSQSYVRIKYIANNQMQKNTPEYTYMSLKVVKYKINI